MQRQYFEQLGLQGATGIPYISASVINFSPLIFGYVWHAPAPPQINHSLSRAKALRCRKSS